MIAAFTSEQREAIEERARALASLVGTPGWESLKDYLKMQTAYVRLDCDDAQWAAKSAYRAGRTELALDLLKVVEASVKRVQKFDAPT